MRLAFPLWQKLISASQVVLMLSMTPAYASLSAGDSLSLARYEVETFGQASPDDTEGKRLDKLEKKLYGKTSKQSTTARLAAISKTLTAQHKELLMPNMAPQLDTSLSNGGSTSGSASSAPRPAPSVAKYDDSYDRDQTPAHSGNQPLLQSTLARALQEYSQGNKSAAQSDFQKVLKIDPQNADAHYNLGALAEEQGDFSSALNQYQLAQKASPEDNDIAQAVSSVKAKLQYQQVAQTQNQQAERIQEQQRQQQKQRDQLKLLAAQAASDYHAGNYDAAIAKLNTVAQGAPNDPDVQFALAQAYRGKKNIDQARFHLNRAVAMDPNNALYRNALNDLNHDSTTANAGMPQPAPDYHNYNQGQGQDQLASAPQDNAPVGQLTPFTDTNSSGMQYGHASAGGSSSGIMRFLPMLGLGGMAAAPMMMGGANGYGGGSPRIARAMQGGLAGAAIGALMSRNSAGGMSGGAMKGALFGGAVGLLFGR
jgi:tetratricopeptide (TPR) repeat protein